MDKLSNTKRLIRARHVRVTQHAQQEMIAEDFTLDEILNAILDSNIIEDYPFHRRGACCLLGGITYNGRLVHIVCTTEYPVVVIITVYEPKLPKWTSLTERKI